MNKLLATIAFPTLLILTQPARCQIPQEKWIRITNQEGDDFHPSFSPDGKHILFDSQRDGHGEVYVANVDGTGASRITNSNAANDHPHWFPSGERIIFESARHGAKDVYSMNADGSNERRLTPNPGFDGAGLVSPDERKIVYAVWVESKTYDLLLMNSDGTSPVVVTNDNTNDYGHTWSPDGSQILFTTERYGKTELMVSDLSGKTRRITNNNFADEGGQWSPHNNRIIFHSDRHGNFEIYSMKTDGSDVRRITDSPSTDGEIAISPDGKKIAFIRGEEQTADIFIIDVNGKHEKQVTKNSQREAVPAWAPDGKSLTFVSDLNGNLEVFVVKL